MSHDTHIIFGYMLIFFQATVRTIRHYDFTPLELAQDLGWDHLYRVLAPVIRHPVPADILQALQERLHRRIRVVVDGMVCRCFSRSRLDEYDAGLT